MLTRLEVRGFKNLLDVEVDFGPFTCIAGANGVGKSNVFDAVEFLSHLADTTMAAAGARVRASAGGGGGDPREIFRNGQPEHERRIRLAAEMIVAPEVDDDLGTPARATSTFLRYELELGYSRSSDRSSSGRLMLLHEQLRPIDRGQVDNHLGFPHNSENFRDAAVVGRGSGEAFLSTEIREGVRIVNVHADGDSAGEPQPRTVNRAGRTVLSTVATNDHPTILAAKREMQSWHRLALEPSSLRAPDSFTDPRTLSADGRHLAGTLYRLATEAGSGGPEMLYARVADRLSDLSGVNVDSLFVASDQVREVFTVFLRERRGLQLPARALSEGTLRFLALCVLLEDSSFTGLVCMEEPENGIHPENLPAMMRLIGDLAVDPHRSPGPDNPFRQVVINTHSPGVVQLCDPAELLLAEARPSRSTDGTVTTALSLLPYRTSWRNSAGASSFSEADIIAYLTPPPGGELHVPTGPVADLPVGGG